MLSCSWLSELKRNIFKNNFSRSGFNDKAPLFDYIFESTNFHFCNRSAQGTWQSVEVTHRNNYALTGFSVGKSRNERRGRDGGSDDNQANNPLRSVFIQVWPLNQSIQFGID